MRDSSICLGEDGSDCLDGLRDGVVDVSKKFVSRILQEDV